MIYKFYLLFVSTMILPVVLAQTNPPSVDVPNLSSYADTEATTNVDFNATNMVSAVRERSIRM